MLIGESYGMEGCFLALCSLQIGREGIESHSHIILGGMLSVGHEPNHHFFVSVTSFLFA